MSVTEALAKRRSIYQLNKELPVSADKVAQTVKKVTELVPDAFNMKSARAVVVTGAKQDELWDKIYDAFGGKVAREKIDGFKAAAGTILYFYDETVVKAMQEQFPLYAANFPVWAKSWKLIAQMPFGGIVAEPDAKEKEDISKRVLVFD